MGWKPKLLLIGVTALATYVFYHLFLTIMPEKASLVAFALILVLTAVGYLGRSGTARSSSVASDTGPGAGIINWYQELSEGRRKLLCAVIFLLGINIFLSWVFWQGAILSSPDVYPLRRALARWTVVAQSFGWIVLLCSTALSFPVIRSILGGLSASGRKLLAALAVGSLIAVWVFPPRTNRIYFDEHIYENIAQTIAVTGEAYMCNEGEAEYGQYKPFAKEYNKQPNGHPFYLSVFYQLFGISEWTAHLAGNVALLIGVLAVFFAAYLLFASEIAGLFAGLIYLLTPQNLIWSATVAAEPPAAALSALAIAASALYVREPSTATATLWGSAVGISIYFRPESICIVVPALLIVFMFRNRELFEPRFYAALLILAICGGIEFLHLYAVRTENWGSSGDRFSWDSFYANFAVNGPYLYLNQRYPAFFTGLAAVGMLCISQWRALLPLLSWLVYSFGIFLFFYAGSFDYGADVRFSMLSAAPLSVFGGLGAAAIVSWLEKRRLTPIANGSFAPFMLAAVLLAWIPFLPVIRTIGMEAADARIDIDAIRDFAKEIPDEALVFSHTPVVWLMLGRNAAQSSVATYNKEHLDNDLFKRYSGGIYFHFGAWCNYDNQVQQSFCSKILESYYTKVVDRRWFGDKHFTLYQLSKDQKPGYQPPFAEGTALSQVIETK